MCTLWSQKPPREEDVLVPGEVVHYAEGDRVALNVGFYYMANATGRLVGTVLSGLTYQLGGLALVLGTAAIMVALASLTSGKLSDQTVAA